MQWHVPGCRGSWQGLPTCCWLSTAEDDTACQLPGHDTSAWDLTPLVAAGIPGIRMPIAGVSRVWAVASNPPEGLQSLVIEPSISTLAC